MAFVSAGVATTTGSATDAQVADLCDPDLLSRTGIGPDHVSSRLRGVTQPIARSLWESGYAWLRRWSRFWGDWHAWVLFVDRLSPKPAFGAPEPLGLDSPPLLEAARLLKVEIAGE